MTTTAQALRPWLYPGPGRTWWGQCGSGHTLYLTKEEVDLHRDATEKREVVDPQYPRITVPISLPCGDTWYSTMYLYKRTDGSYFYA